MTSNGKRLTPALGALAIAAFVAVGCGGGGDGGDAAAGERIAKGEKLFQRTCATCHGVDGRGMPRLGKDLHHNQFTKGLTDQQMLAFLKEGRPAYHPDNTQGVDMPPRGGNPNLTDEDLLAIIAFQRTWSPR